jgi:hypothetical protein
MVLIVVPIGPPNSYSCFSFLPVLRDEVREEEGAGDVAGELEREGWREEGTISEPFSGIQGRRCNITSLPSPATGQRPSRGSAHCDFLPPSLAQRTFWTGCIFSRLPLTSDSVLPSFSERIPSSGKPYNGDASLGEACGVGLVPPDFVGSSSSRASPPTSCIAKSAADVEVSTHTLILRDIKGFSF